MSAPYLAVDFGTSNCAAGFMLDQQPHLLALEQDGSRYLSSALYIERQRDPEDEDAYLSASLTRLLAQNSTVLVGKAAHGGARLRQGREGIRFGIGHAAQ